MIRSPMTRQRSEWRPMPVSGTHRALQAMGSEDVAIWQRDVGDGHLMAVVAREPLGPQRALRWHMSISHRTNGAKPKPGRYPRWDEIADARYALCPDGITLAMLLPPTDEYVALHDTTFHLHEIDAEVGR